MRSIYLFTLVLCSLFLNGWCEEEDGETDQIISSYRVPNNRVYPYMVYFTQRNRMRQDLFICSGTLVGPRKVLTAASCFERFDSNTFQPTFFTPVARMNTDVLGGPFTISRKVIRVVKHPQYNPANAGNHDNIAVVTLDVEVLASSVTPVQLGTSAPFPRIGIDQLVTVGWGYSENTLSSYLFHGPLKLVEDSSCRTVFGNVDNAYTICAAYTNVGACTFDVGSPILFNGKQIGVVGKNMRCGGSDPIVAVDVRAMASFIFPLLP